MLISTNKQINSIFSGSLNKEPLYFSKRNQAKTELKAISFESVENIDTLQPFDRLVFFAILTHTQSGSGVVSLPYLYRIITGVKTPISGKTRTAMRESIERLSKVILQPVRHKTSKDKEKSDRKPLIIYSENWSSSGKRPYRRASILSVMDWKSSGLSLKSSWSPSIMSSSPG